MRAALLSVLAAALCGGVVRPAGAQSWTSQTGARAALETNNNPALSAGDSDRLQTVRVTTSANAERGDEQGATRAEAELVLDASRQAGRGDSSALGRLALSHRITTDRETWSAQLGYRRDRPLDSGRTASDIAFGRGEQAVSDLALGWSHALSERLSLDLDASLGHTQVSNTAAGQDYRLASGSAGLKYRWHETGTLTASLSRTRQRLSSGEQRSDVDSLRLRWSEVLSERASLQLSVAQSTTQQQVVVRGLVCPLPIGFCRGGLVPFQLAEDTLQLRRRSLQYDTSGSWRWRETSTLAASASRKLTPGTQGVSQDDAYGFSLTQELGPHTQASLALDSSRNRSAGAAGAAAGQVHGIALTATHQLEERLTLQFQARQQRYRRAAPEPGATGTVFSISLQYLSATVPLWP